MTEYIAVNSNNLIEELQKIRQEIEQEKDGYPPSADEYMTINRVIKIVDTHIKETQMRNATKEEIESIDAYINSISETMIPLSVLQEIRQEIEQEKDGYPPSADEYMAINRVIKIIDKYLKEETDETDN